MAGLASILEQNSQLQDAIVDCIEKTITRHFGESVLRVLEYNFRRDTGLAIQEVVQGYDYARAFSEFLSRFFGSGGMIIERIIFEELGKTFPNTEIAFKGRNIDLAKLIAEIKRLQK